MFDDDKLREECGVFGIKAPENEDVKMTIYYGLLALQHRGQESAGMALCQTDGPKGNINYHKDLGLVSEVFHDDVMEKLHGNMGIGHVRYSTTGANIIENAQPLVLNYIKGTLALVHNGNITNAQELKEKLQQTGALFHTTTDSEVIAYMIAQNRTKSGSVEGAVKEAVKLIKGGYAIIIMSPRKLVGVRDPLGIKPLCLGKRTDENGKVSYILASESAAVNSVDAEFVRDVEPGEIITITDEGIKSEKFSNDSRRAHCIFEYIYFARLDSEIDGINVHDARINAGRILARKYPVDADIVVGVPESGLAAAEGYAMEAGIPFKLGFYKNSYVGRTFIKPTQDERESAVHVKLNILKSVVRGKRVVLIDDSIVRGTTISQLIRTMKEYGAKEVHVRISSPRFLYPCFYGTDVPSSSELIASAQSVNEICDSIGADSLGYLSVEDFKDMTGNLGICKACFDSDYPVR